jgi:hydroxymethylbilane synthase
LGRHIDTSTRIIIGTRPSPLALWQAGHVAALLQERCGIATTLKKITTKGDKIRDRSLVEIGGKGLFLKEIEDHLLTGAIDIAVHSMKDVPHTLPPGLIIAAILPREAPGDVFLSGRYASFDRLPAGAKIGTSSLRRVIQLKQRRADLSFVPLRGNVDSRVRKLATAEFDAVVLAAAGLERLKLTAPYAQNLDIIPAVGQGAIGIECQAGAPVQNQVRQSLNDRVTERCVGLERYFLQKVQGSCQTPVGCYVQERPAGQRFTLSYFIADPDGSWWLGETASGAWGDAESIIDGIAARARRD